MSKFFTRARVWVLLSVVAYAPLATSQNVELITGQGRFVDIPGTTVGFQPGAMAIAADGYLYTNDINGKLMRLNIATGAVTALPAIPGGLNHDLGWSYGIATDPSGVAHVTSQGGLHRINADGTLTRVRDLGYTGPMAFGADGTIYMVPGDNRVYAHRPDGAVDIIAGGEETGFAGDGGPAVDALLSFPQGIAVGPDGNVYVSDSDNNRIRKIDLASGIITTFAGAGGSGYSGDGVPATQTDIGRPRGIAFDGAGNLYIGAELGSARVVRVDATSTLVTTVVGNGTFGMSGDDGPALAAGVSAPRFITVAANGNVFFTDGDGYKYIRKVDAATGIVSRVLGFASFHFCGEGVPANQGCLAQPVGVDVNRSSGDVIISDAALTRLRRISGGNVSTYATLTAAPTGIDHDLQGNLYVMGGHKVTRYDRLTGAATVVAGGNGLGFSGDGGPATAAHIGTVGDVAVDTSGNLYILDSMNSRVRKVTASTGIITTVQTFGSSPSTIEINPTGEIYVSEGCRLHRMNSTTYAVIQTLGTTTCATQDPPGGTPVSTTNLGSTRAFTFDAQGHLYIAWSNQIYRVYNNTSTLNLIRRPPQGWVTAEGVKFERPNGMSFDSSGRLYISQESKPYLFRMTGLTDNTAPVITAHVVGLRGVGNWYRSDVHVTFTVTDPESYVVITSGCQGGSVITDTVDGFSIPFECQANSLGGSASRGEAIRRDTRLPTLTWGTPTPAPDANGWNYTNVSIPFTRDDGPSGIQSSSSTSPLVISGLGTGLTRTVTLTDFAGNVATFTSPPVNIASAAVIQEQITGTLGNNGWYRDNVQVSWNITAPNITSSTGCGATVISTDTAGTTLTCSVTTPSGTVSKSVTVKRDTTPPAISFGARSPLPNADGWNGSAVNAPYTATDAMSGVASATPANPLVFNQAGAGQSRQVEVTDLAGNVATFQSPPVNIDLSLPTIDATVSGLPGNNGWHRGEVNVHFTVSSPLSPVRTGAGCLDVRVNVDTAGLTYTCVAINAAGTSTKPVTFKIDQTPPTVTLGALSPLPNTNGWNTSIVNVAYTAADAMSGIASATPASPLVFSEAGAGQSRQVQVTDLAGNSATVQSPVVNIDLSPPTVTVAVSGTAGNDGWYRSDVVVDWTVPASVSPAQTTGCADTSVTSDTADITFTCTATNVVGSATKSVTIKRDATAPTLAYGAASPAPDDAGWRAAPVSVPFTVSDALSGLASQSSPSPLAITQTGAGVTGQVVVTDVAGNSATFTTPAFKIDNTPPDLTYFIYGTLSGNGSGWYRTDVRVQFGAIDAETYLVSKTGDCDVTLTTDSPGTTYTCTATSVGGTVSKSVTIKRDTTPPVLTWGAPSPEANAIGWHTTDVSFPYTVIDATSGYASNSPGNDEPVIVPFDGPGVSNQITVGDEAGNQATFHTPPVNIDRAPPAVTPAVTGTPGADGWFTSDVQVEWQVNKAPENLLSQSGCVNSTVTEDTAGITFSCSATSGAGTTNSSITIKRDATPPVLSFGTPSPVPNSAGWNKTNVSIAFTRSDALSGLASTSTTSPLVLSTEGAGISGQVTVTDNAGNATTFTSPARNIDKTAPDVEAASPEDGATYGFYQDVVADYWCNDIAPLSCTAPTLNGELVNTRTAGARTFKITGKDLAGFTATHTHAFTVESLFNFEGFLAPANEPPTLNLVTRGSMVPIRWRLPDGRGGYVTSTASFTSATVGSLTCGSATVAPLNDPASGPAGISFDAATSTFTYNWQTTASWTGCRKLTIKLKDNTLHELRFRFQ